MRVAVGRIFLLAFVIAIVASFAAAKEYPTISYKEAPEHVGEIVWVQGTILKTKAAPEGTYLYFSNNPGKYIRLIIPREYLKNFAGDPKHMYAGKKIKAVGKVAQDGHRLIMGVSEPKRIKVIESET